MRQQNIKMSRYQLSKNHWDMQLDFVGPLEANYKTQSLGSPCSRQQHLTHTIDICLMEFFGRDFLLPVVVNGHGSKVQVGRSQVSFSFGHHCSV